MILFFDPTPPTEIYTLSLHDALPISLCGIRSPLRLRCNQPKEGEPVCSCSTNGWGVRSQRSEEHTSELQSHSELVCRLLLENKKYRMRNGLETSQRPKLAEGQSLR